MAPIVIDPPTSVQYPWGSDNFQAVEREDGPRLND